MAIAEVLACSTLEWLTVTAASYHVNRSSLRILGHGEADCQKRHNYFLNS
jgi:hypothetical protein